MKHQGDYTFEQWEKIEEKIHKDRIKKAQIGVRVTRARLDFERENGQPTTRFEEFHQGAVEAEAFCRQLYEAWKARCRVRARIEHESVVYWRERELKEERRREQQRKRRQVKPAP